MEIQNIHLLKSFYDLEPQLEEFGEAVDKGLSSKNKSLPWLFSLTYHPQLNMP